MGRRDLLVGRGEERVVSEEPDRYWEAPLAGIRDLETGCAVGAHAEAMRLERVAVICADERAPSDIRAVFQKTLPEERVHAAAFAQLATPEAPEATRGGREPGRKALGLTP
ncbi:MAG: hypothetical protein AB8I08_14110 [Sandaracinaceae bacterium]